MIKNEKFLTNEKIRGLFANNFDLANYAIYLAREYMGHGDPKSLGQLIQELERKTKEKKEAGNV